MNRTGLLEYLRGKGLHAFERCEDLVVVARDPQSHRGVTYYSNVVFITRSNGGWIAERGGVGVRPASNSEVLDLAQACARAELLLAPSGSRS
jgi:hypothetical protein